MSSSRMFRLPAALLAVATAAALAACAPQDLTEAEKATIASLALSALPPLPADPSNRHADDPQAAAFGRALFFDKRLSGDGTVACATCHLETRAFQDDLPRSVGLGTTDRRAMPLAGAAYSPFVFWDGRKDSLWAQALGPLEDPREHGGNRTGYARVVAAAYRAPYEALFGPLPALPQAPEAASPLGTDAQKAAWTAMAEGEREAIDRVFANLGKAIAAFERTIAHRPTRFDRFAEALAAGRTPAGDAALSEQEIYGLRLFIGRAGCITCHTGPRFTDEHFHNTGVPPVDGLPEDRGRAAGAPKAAADPFNCLGRFSDAPAEACGELRFMVKDGEELERAFKTPSLRGAAARPPYMHAGQIATLEAVVDHYVRAPESPKGHSEVKPLKLSEKERAALVAFLGTLSE